MSGGSSPKGPVSERDHVPEGTHELTDDVRGIVLDEVPEFRDVTTIHDPTGLCGLVELRSDLRAEFVCGAGSPVWSPMEGIQTDMRYI